MTMRRTVVLECDGQICTPTSPETQGPLGGAHLTVLAGGSATDVRRYAARTYGWSYDPRTKKDRCPTCQSPHPAP